MTTQSTELRWRTSSFSGGSGQCVEVGYDPNEPGGQMLIRDSKNPMGGWLPVSRQQLRQLAEIAIER